MNSSTPSQGVETVLTFNEVRSGGGLIVDCAADPYDLRPAQAGILERVQEVSARLRGRQPLVVLMGERHMTPAVKMLQTMVLDHLAKAAPSQVACGIEYPHDGLGVLMSRCGFSVASSSYPVLKHQDGDGQRGLMVSLAALTLPDAPVTHDTLLDYCRRQGLSTRFTDAAQTEDGVLLNSADPLTADVMMRCAPGVPEDKIPVASNVGMALRNVAIVQNVVTHIQDTGASLYVQHCGVDHIYGHRGDHCAYEHSLTSLFAQAGVMTVPVFTGGDADIAAIPLAASVAFDNSVIITNLSEGNFRAGDPGEADFIRALGQHSGVDFNVFEKASLDHKTLIQVLRQAGPQWLASLRI